MHISVFAARLVASLSSHSGLSLTCAAILWCGDLCAKNEKLPKAALASLQELDSKWTDQAGQIYSFASSRGHVVVLSLMYTSCQQSCPLIIGEIKSIVQALPEALRPKVQILLFSFDPERDTGQRLAAYASERKLETNWKLLRGSIDEVQELAAVLNFRVKRLMSGDYSHSNTITILDQNGEVRHQQENLFAGRDQSIATLKELFK